MRLRPPAWLLAAALLLAVRDGAPPAAGEVASSESGAPRIAKLAVDPSADARKKVPARRLRPERGTPTTAQIDVEGFRAAELRVDAAREPEPTPPAPGGERSVLLSVVPRRTDGAKAPEAGVGARAADKPVVVARKPENAPKPNALPRTAAVPRPIAVPQPSKGPEQKSAASVGHRPWALEPEASSAERVGWTDRTTKVVAPSPSSAPAFKPPQPPVAASREIVIPGLAQRLEAGVQAAERRALYTARATFLDVLGQLAEQTGLGGPQTRSAALAEALTTLDEADDFIGAAAGPVGEPSRTAAGHRSVAGKTLPLGATPSQAARHYQAYAAGRLAAALGRSRQASYALFCLGKVHSLLALEPSSGVRNAAAKAEAYFAAALRTDAANWQAANELGVMLARQGRFAEAAACLRQSAAIQPRPESLHNLAVALHCAGNTAEAQDARQKALALGYGRDTARRPEVHWVAPETLRGGTVANGDATPADAAEEQAPRVSDRRASTGASRKQASQPGGWKPAPLPDEGDEDAEADEDNSETEERTMERPVKGAGARRAAERRGLLWWLPWN